MSRIYSLYLHDIVNASERIASYVEEIAYTEFEMDQMRIDAVIRNLQIIGEAVKKLPESMRDKYPNIAWQEIAGMRNRVTHVYFNVDINIIWEVVQNVRSVLPGWNHFAIRSSVVSINNKQ